MKKFFGFLMFVGVIALAACGSTGGGDDGSGCGEACGGGSCGGSSKMDSSQSTIDMYVNGTIKAQYWVQVHAEPKAGQYWETAGEAYGTTSTQRWQVAKVDGDMAVIEWEMKSDSEYAMSDYIIAFQVDLSVTTAGDVNVSKAWIGKPGEAGAEIAVMEKPDATCGGATSDYEITNEDFTDVEMGGGKWSGNLQTIKGEGFEMKTWTAKDGWFNGVIKTEMNGATQSELKAFGEDATPLLKW